MSFLNVKLFVATLQVSTPVNAQSFSVAGNWLSLQIKKGDICNNATMTTVTETLLCLLGGTTKLMIIHVKGFTEVTHLTKLTISEF